MFYGEGGEYRSREVESNSRFSGRILRRIEANDRQLKKMLEGGYEFPLNELNPDESALAAELLDVMGIDVAAPLGSLNFRSPHDRFQAIQTLTELKPDIFSWRWRQASEPGLIEGMSLNEAKAYLRTMPIRSDLLPEPEGEA